MPDEGNYGAHPRADMPEPSDVEALTQKLGEFAKRIRSDRDMLLVCEAIGALKTTTAKLTSETAAREEAEREACARIADAEDAAITQRVTVEGRPSSIAASIAAAIRARTAAALEAPDA